MNKKIKVWIIDSDLKVRSMAKRDWVLQWRDETTTPLGSGPRHDRDGKRLFCWHRDGSRYFFADEDTVREANKRLWEIWTQEAHENDNAEWIYFSRAEANAVRQELLADRAADA